MKIYILLFIIHSFPLCAMQWLEQTLTSRNKTLLHTALLLGYNPNRTSSNPPPLEKALQEKKFDHADLLIKYGAAIDTSGPHGSTMLHRAASDEDNNEIFLWLVSNGADIHKKNNFGWQAIHYAAFYNRAQNIHTLLEHGADHNAQTNCGATPLHLTSFSRQLNSARQLLADNADCTRINSKKQTPLIELCFTWQEENNDQENIIEIARLLVFDAFKKGIKPNDYVATQDDYNMCALDYAVQKNMPDLLELLRNPYQAICPMILQEKLKRSGMSLTAYLAKRPLGLVQ